MVKVNMITTGGRKSDVLDENLTIREVFNKFGVDYATATNQIDGTKLDTAGLDKTLAQWGVTTECRIASIVKTDNAATINISGASAVLVSGVTLADWKRAEKLMPEALAITDEDGNVMFRVGTSEGPGSVSEYGVNFGNATNEGGLATVTIVFDDEVKDRMEAAKETMGDPLLKLCEIEDNMPNVLRTIEEKEAKIGALITAQ